MNILRYIQIALAIMTIALFLYIAFTPKEEAFTEIYFTEFVESPAHINLSFTVKNHEPSGTEYSYVISVERHLDSGVHREEKTRGTFWLEKGESTAITEGIALDGVYSGNTSISVELYKGGERYRVIWKWINVGDSR